MLYTLTMLCTSSKPVNIFFESDVAFANADWRKLVQNCCEPMGAPKTRKPSTTSTFDMSPISFFSLEYLEIASSRSFPR